jgi:hypothetical protein
MSPHFLKNVFFKRTTNMSKDLFISLCGRKVKFDYNFQQMNQSTMFCFCFYLAPLTRDTLWKWQYEFKIIPVNLILSLELS